MTDLYRMIDELHAIVTSPEFFKVRYPKAMEIERGLFVATEFNDFGFKVIFTNFTGNNYEVGEFKA